MQFNKKKAAAVVAATTIGLAGAGVAFAYWSSSGTGSGTATTGTTTNFTVLTGDPAGGPLSPGGPSETVSYTVHNNDSGWENLNKVEISVATSGGGTWDSVAGCSAADFNIDNAGAGLTATDTDGAGELAPNGQSGDTYTGSITIQMVDSGSNQDGCQNLSGVPLYLSAS